MRSVLINLIIPIENCGKVIDTQPNNILLPNTYMACQLYAPLITGSCEPEGGHHRIVNPKIISHPAKKSIRKAKSTREVWKTQPTGCAKAL